MKKYLIILFIFIVSIMLSTPVYAQSAKDAIMGLKKLQARVQSGISYRDYSNALADAKFPVNVFMESTDAQTFPELNDSINKTMKHYEYAGTLWNLKMSGLNIDINYGFFKVDSDIGRNIKRLYPQADQALVNSVSSYFLDKLLPIIWEAASQELGYASKLYAQSEKTATNETVNLKKENEDLKKEIAKLKKEIAKMKGKTRK